MEPGAEQFIDTDQMLHSKDTSAQAFRSPLELLCLKKKNIIKSTQDPISRETGSYTEPALLIQQGVQMQDKV